MRRVTQPHTHTNVYRHTKEKKRIELMRHSEHQKIKCSMLKVCFFKSYVKIKQLKQKSVWLISGVNRPVAYVFPAKWQKVYVPPSTKVKQVHK